MATTATEKEKEMATPRIDKWRIRITPTSISMLSPEGKEWGDVSTNTRQKSRAVTFFSSFLIAHASSYATAKLVPLPKFRAEEESEDEKTWDDSKAWEEEVQNRNLQGWQEEAQKRGLAFQPTFKAAEENEAAEGNKEAKQKAFKETAQRRRLVFWALFFLATFSAARWSLFTHTYSLAWKEEGTKKSKKLRTTPIKALNPLAIASADFPNTRYDLNFTTRKLTQFTRLPNAKTWNPAGPEWTLAMPVVEEQHVTAGLVTSAVITVDIPQTSDEQLRGSCLLAALTMYGQTASRLGLLVDVATFITKTLGIAASGFASLLTIALALEVARGMRYKGEVQ